MDDWTLDNSRILPLSQQNSELHIVSNLCFYETHVYMGSDLWVLVSVSLYFWDLTDVTLADEDTNSILTDNANRAFQRNVAMQVTQAGGKICN